MLLQTLREQVENYIAQLHLDDKRPARLYQPMQYILALPGKRIRPLLTLLGYHIVSKKAPQQALSLGCAVELFHNFSLIHDDIMDNAPTRRGKPTVHEKWDNNVAILSGDAMFAISYGLIVKDFPEKAAPLIEIFTQAAVEVCEGQMEDMDLATRDAVAIPEYIEMIRKKTSVLLGAALKLGAVAAGASEALAEKMYKFGVCVGIGFQIQDDFMDAFPSEGFGKQVGGDIIENKKTFLLLKTLEMADTEQAATLFQLMYRETDMKAKVEGVLSLYHALNIPAHTEAMIQYYFRQAEALLQEMESEVEVTLLEDIMRSVLNRKV